MSPGEFYTDKNKRHVVTISDATKQKAADQLIQHLAESGIDSVGGKSWWQYRLHPLKGEWIEMKSTRHLRAKGKLLNDKLTILYVHGGAFCFCSVDTERYMIQRHARNLRARAFAPNYRLAPQYPFPCALHDVLAAYTYLVEECDLCPSTDLLVMGDSAGANLVLALLCVLRDLNLSLPAAAMLLSPWVDLTHSFPSIMSEDTSGDYIPPQGFHYRPSAYWPPPEGERADEITAEDLVIKEQIQLYAPNHLLRHPLVSPCLQESLGGLCPLLVTCGGAELLRDEAIYIAHKAAQTGGRYTPTKVQLQVFDDCCHVVPTLSFTKPARFMFRSVANFGLWATKPKEDASETSDIVKVTKALPPFKENMIRERVSTTGVIRPMEPASEVACLNLDPASIGQAKVGTLRKWIKAQTSYDDRFRKHKDRVKRRRLRDYERAEKDGYVNEMMRIESIPLGALAARPTAGASSFTSQLDRKPSLAMHIWTKFSSREDKHKEQD